MNDTSGDSGPAQASVEAFIERWQDTTGKERANYQLFLTELCQALGLPGPEPAMDDTAENRYVFERRVDIRHPDGNASRGYIDLYKSGHFVLEAKKVSEEHRSSRWDKAMLRAAAQADAYIRALPAEDGRPPFLLTCDVGKTIEVYAEFTRSGATYVPFPDPRTHRIHLEDLRDPDIQQRLIGIWTNPDALDPAKRAARVTRELSRTLAGLAKALEKDGYEVERVAHFIKRCLFTMFAEDVDLLPKGQFTALLERLKDTPEHFPDAIKSLWETMHSGGYSGVLNSKILQFNGTLFRDINPIPLNSQQIELLIDAARHDWSEVEPAIFGTLLERALDPEDRHKLGAHYTPRAYVERLVMPTIIDPLRDEWKDVQAAAVALEAQDKHDQAVKEIRNFHRKLCDIKVLDPACGSANFLYVTLEHMKRLEGEVLNTLADLGESQNLLEMQGNTVDPHQFLGIEINPRAAAIAEMVLWIGYLQWHFRTHGHINPPQPVLKAFKNIECRDAVLAYDRWEYKMNEDGRPVMRWDGKTYKKSPTTGEDIPDESAQVPEEVYINPKKAEWPAADYVVGNPPFIGNKRMRTALGDGYVEALRNAWQKDVPGSADFVMYWWNHAANLVRSGELHQFGLITTNSLRQGFNRKVVEEHLSAKTPLTLVFAIPDHPWIDSSDGAAVRIAMSAASSKELLGTLGTVVSKAKTAEGEEQDIDIQWEHGKILADFRIGADISSTSALKSNSRLAFTGMYPLGQGFVLLDTELKRACGADQSSEEIVKPFITARDLTQRDRSAKIIDFYPLTKDEARERHPSLFQWISERVKPERDQNPVKERRENWWLFTRPIPALREAISSLQFYVAVPRTAKHLTFNPVRKQTIPDTSVVAIAIDDYQLIGVLCSRIHALWAIASGGRLGVGNDLRYQHASTFNKFPFPELKSRPETNISSIAQQLLNLRNSQKTQNPTITLTGMYNVLEKLRREEPLTDKEKEIHEQGLVSVLRELHDDLDRAVFSAYGWNDLAKKLVGRPGATTPWPEKPEDQLETEEELLQRLVDLNHQRAAEEAKGKTRWLRPDYQAPEEAATQGELATEETDATNQPTSKQANQPTKKLAWPKTLQAQIRSVRDQLATRSMDAKTLATSYKRKPEKSVAQVLDALTELGMIDQEDDGQYRLKDS